MSPTSSLPAWFTHAIEALQAGDISGWMEIYASDAIHEFPFAPVGAVRRLEGRDAISAYMSQLPSRIRFGSLSDVRVREVGYTSSKLRDITGASRTKPRGRLTISGSSPDATAR
jgi:hypothetical protein